jgi:hypothetical protein
MDVEEWVVGVSVCVASPLPGVQLECGMEQWPSSWWIFGVVAQALNM